MLAACRVTCSTHHPWYTTDTSYKEFDQMRQQMEPLLYKYGVDIFFNGDPPFSKLSALTQELL